MSNQWLRLWHDMPTDPKWRTIAKVSGQRIGDVIAVYTHLLVAASTNAPERGRTQSFNAEDVASALDLETNAVDAIVDAMQLRVLDGDRMKGWDKRQPEREDGSAERAKAWRENQKALKEAEKAQKMADELAANDAERNRTQDELDRTLEERRREEEKIGNTKAAPKRAPFNAEAVDLPDWLSPETWGLWVRHRIAKRKPLTEDGALLSIKSLADMREQGIDPRAAIEHGVASGNQGLFPPPGRRGAAPRVETATRNAQAAAILGFDEPETFDETR